MHKNQKRVLTNFDSRVNLEFLSDEGAIYTAVKLFIIGEKVNPSESYSGGFYFKGD